MLAHLCNLFKVIYSTPFVLSFFRLDGSNEVARLFGALLDAVCSDFQETFGGF
jgi:hypothetical protein